MGVQEIGFAVQLTQSSPQDWAWAVLDEQGDEAASGRSASEIIAREQAEFFRRSLTRFRRVTRGW